MGCSPRLPEDKCKRFHDRSSAARYIHDVYNLRATKRAIARWYIPGKIVHGRFTMTEHDIDSYVEKLLDEAPAAGASTRDRLERARRARTAVRQDREDSNLTTEA
jgi:hypothetical protein